MCTEIGAELWTIAKHALMRRSSKAIHEAASERAVWRRRPSPDPGAGVTVELSGGDAGGVGDILGVGQRHAREGFAAEEPPPACDEVQPGGADRNEGVLDARMVRQPVADRATEMAGEMVGDEIQVATRRGCVDGVQQRQIPGGVACGGGLSSAPARRAPPAPRTPTLCPVPAHSRAAL